MADELNKLAERVEALTGPCEQTDEAIFFALYPRGGFDAPRINVPTHYSTIIPRYCSSLDAAMSLLPNMETEDGTRHADFILECTNAGLTIAAMVGHDDRDRCSWGATPALALTAAALRAREVIDHMAGQEVDA